MTATEVFLTIAAAVIVVPWAAARCRAWRAEARERAIAREAEAARLKAVRRHPSRVPGLPVDGEPLSEAPGGEAEQFAALLYQFRHGREPNAGKHGSPPAEGKRQ